MKQKLDIILYASAHLPLGCPDSVFEALYDTEIKPLISSLDKYPAFNMVFHYSGVILYWIERKHPEFFMLLEDLFSRKQAEFLGGGFYNPAFTLLPLADKIGQIEMLTTYLRKHFGKKPQGCYLPEMAWEQNFVAPLNSCGMNYTFLNENQFLEAGLKPNKAGLFSPCITEDQGKLITVFPVSKTLSAELLNGNPLNIINELLNKLPEETDPNVIVLPLVKTEYESFFQALSKTDQEVKFTCPSKIYKNLHTQNKIYFPGVWASKNDPKSETNPRQFLVDYPEAGDLYAKMIYIHTLINNQLRGDKPRKRTAFEELWKAQDSNLFRLGSAFSPGFLHSPVRKAAYHSLLEAEKIIREKNRVSPSLSVFDFDLDGKGEYIFQDEKLSFFVKPLGAGIFELDYLPAAWNYLDTLALRKESCKSKRRCSFVDWFAPVNTPPSDIGMNGINAGRFCGNEDFEVSDTDRVQRRVIFNLPAKPDLPWGEIEMAKTWQLKKNSLAVEYVLKNSGTKNSKFLFCTQMDFSFAGEGEGFFRVFNLKSSEGEKENLLFTSGTRSINNIRGLEFQDLKNETLISLELSRSFDVNIFNVNASLEGHEEYQSTCVMPFIQVSLETGKSWKVSFSLKISS